MVLPGRQSFEVRTLDLSPGGMAIVAEANPSVGTTFTVRFRLNQHADGFITVAATARVAHTIFSAEEDGFKIGLTFVNLSPESTQAIARFMK